MALRPKPAKLRAAKVRRLSSCTQHHVAMKVADKKDRRAHILSFNRSLNFYRHILQIGGAKQPNYIECRATGTGRSEPVAAKLRDT